MSKEWIDSLSNSIKEIGRADAEAYGREQHRLGVVERLSPGFFAMLAQYLEEDFAAIRTRLQGSAVAAETAVERVAPSELHLTRARFPWFDATLKHEGDTLGLAYAKSRTTEPALTPDRQSVHFTFQVDANDRLSVAQSFADPPQAFATPEDLSRHVVELLLKP